jgi:hypothetical protein
LKRFIVLSALLTLAACGGDSGTSGTPINGTLVVEDLVVGTGATAVAGDTVSVNYLGTLTNGRSSTPPPTTEGPTRSGWAWER